MCYSLPQALGEPLYRVSTGNYEYRLILRCRQEARARFSQMRKDVLEKVELLDQKHGEGPGWPPGPLTVTPHLSQSHHRPRYGGAEPFFSPFQSWGPRARPCRALSQTQDGESWQGHTHLPGAWPGGTGPRP